MSGILVVVIVSLRWTSLVSGILVVVIVSLRKLSLCQVYL